MVESTDFTPIDPTNVPDAELPSGMLFTRHVTQKHLAEVKRALGRDPLKHEVQILDSVMHAQETANRRLARRGLLRRTHSMDEVVGVFIERLQHADAKRIADDMLNGS